MKQNANRLLLYASLSLIIMSIVITTPSALYHGMIKIIYHPDMLIADYIAIGGFGPALFNASLLVFVSAYLMKLSKADGTGLNIAAVILMGSFGLFGKNIFSVIPIIMGTYLFAHLTKEPFKDVIATALFATSFSPIVTELVFHTSMSHTFAFVIGISIGFLIVPVSRHLFNVHKGFNLYNVGFSIGILSTLYVSVMKSYGYTAKSQLILSKLNTTLSFVILAGSFLFLFLLGIYYDPKALIKMKSLLKESGYKNNDYYVKYGLGTTLVNMALNGILSLVYVVFIAQGSLNGPSIGGILTVVGFGGLGKHARNIIPIFLGVYLGSLTHFWNAHDMGIIFAALFGTALAPIAGHFGFIYGVIASLINASVVLSSGSLHAGLNLYNTGFSVGIVSGVLVPVFILFKERVSLPIRKKLIQ